MRLNQKIPFVIYSIALALLIYAFIALFGHYGVDSRYKPHRWVNLEAETEPLNPGASKNPLLENPIRVAVAPVLSPERSLEMYQWFVDYLGAALQRKAILIQRHSYAEVNDLIRHRISDIAFICTYPFVQAERDFGAQILVVPQIDGKITYKSYIIVPRASQSISLLYLRGKRFGASEILSNSGWLFPAVWLLERGEDPDHFFQERVLTGSHDRSIMAVATGYVDGAAVDSLIYDHMVKEDPSLLQQTKIIMESMDFGIPPVVVHPKMDPALRESIKEILLSMDRNQGGKIVLRKLGIDRFVIPDSALYDSVRKASAVWESH